MIEGAAILLAGILIGVAGDRLLSRFPVRIKGLPKPKAPRCSCGHAPSFHDPETGQCHRQWIEEVNYHDKWVTCECRRYDGPTPLPEYYAQEITP